MSCWMARARSRYTPENRGGGRGAEAGDSGEGMGRRAVGLKERGGEATDALD